MSVNEIQMVDLPVENERAIEEAALNLTVALRNSVELPPEALDWLDWANNHALTAQGKH